MIKNIRDSVARALSEDIGAGDVTADLIQPRATIKATVITREAMTMAGRPWFDQVMRQVDGSIDIDWHFDDGDTIGAGESLCDLHGPARSILTAERTALNFLQLMSATATVTAQYVAAVADTDCRILDTRKTLPGLRFEQKYAVKCGGGINHRIGLFGLKANRRPNLRRQAESRSTLFVISPRPASTIFRLAHSPRTFAPSIYRCVSHRYATAKNSCAIPCSFPVISDRILNQF